MLTVVASFYYILFKLCCLLLLRMSGFLLPFWALSHTMGLIHSTEKAEVRFCKDATEQGTTDLLSQREATFKYQPAPVLLLHVMYMWKRKAYKMGKYSGCVKSTSHQSSPFIVGQQSSSQWRALLWLVPGNTSESQKWRKPPRQVAQCL